MKLGESHSSSGHWYLALYVRVRPSSSMQASGFSGGQWQLILGTASLLAHHFLRREGVLKCDKWALEGEQDSQTTRFTSGLQEQMEMGVFLTFMSLAASQQLDLYIGVLRPISLEEINKSSSIRRTVTSAILKLSVLTIKAINAFLDTFVGC